MRERAPHRIVLALACLVRSWARQLCFNWSPVFPVLRRVELYSKNAFFDLIVVSLVGLRTRLGQCQELMITQVVDTFGLAIDTIKSENCPK